MKPDERKQPAKNRAEFLAAIPEENRTVPEAIPQTIRPAAPRAEGAVRYPGLSSKTRAPPVFFIVFRDHSGIEPQGGVRPCIFMPIKSGNIQQQPVPEIRDNAEIFKKVSGRDLLTGNSGSCTNKYISSRCRAWTYLLDREPLAPGCTKKISPRNNHRNLNKRPADDRSPMEKNA